MKIKFKLFKVKDKVMYRNKIMYINTIYLGGFYPEIDVTSRENRWVETICNRNDLQII